MANRSGKGNRGQAPGKARGQTPRETRVYAPTHRAGSDSAGPARKPQKQQARATQEEPDNPMVREMPQGRQLAYRPPAAQTPKAQQPRRQSPPAGKTVLRPPEDPAPQRPTPRRQEKQAAARKAKPGYDSIHRVEHVERKEELARKEAQREQRRKQRRARREQRGPMDRNKLLGWLIALVVFVGLVLAGYFVFLVDSILVDGTQRYSESSIVSLSGLVQGRHMLLSNVEKAAEAIEENPYIKVISVERELPRTIRITIEERVEAAAIAVQDYHVIIDIDGHVLSIGTEKDPAGLLRITGISQLGFKVNQQLGPGSDIQIKALLLILEQLVQEELREDIVAIDLTNPLRLTMQTTDDVTVVLGQSDNLPEKMRWLKLTLPSLRGGGITGGTLDVSAKGGAIYSPKELAPQDTPDTQTQDPDTPEDLQDPTDPDTDDPENDPQPGTATPTQE